MLNVFLVSIYKFKSVGSDLNNEKQSFTKTLLMSIIHQNSKKLLDLKPA